MSESSTSAASLSARFEDWFKSQPQAQSAARSHSTDPEHPAQQTSGVLASKRAKRLPPPLRYDFDSKYKTGSARSSIARQASALFSKNDEPKDDADCNHARGTGHEVISILDFGSPPLRHQASETWDEPPSATTIAESTGDTATLVGSAKPHDHDVEDPDQRKKSWLRSHLKIIIILVVLFQLGIISLTISIVLGTQDGKSGHIRDGTVISGVLGLCGMICSIVTGYDVLFAKYSGSRHQSSGTIDDEANKGIAEKNKEAGWLDLMQDDPKSKYKIDFTHLPHNTDHSGRLSNPFNPRLTIDCGNSPSFEIPSESWNLTPQDVLDLNRDHLTPEAPSPIPIAHPQIGAQIRWSRAVNNRSGAPRSRPGSLAIPETWAQRLERGLRPPSFALPALPDGIEVEEPVSARKQDFEIDTDYGLSRTTSRILSIYSSLDSQNDEYQRDSIGSMTMSPLNQDFDMRRQSLYTIRGEDDALNTAAYGNEGRPSSWPLPIIRISAATTQSADSQAQQPEPQEHIVAVQNVLPNDLIQLWHQYLASMESPSRTTIASSAHQSHLWNTGGQVRVTSWPISRPTSRLDGNHAGGPSRRDTQAWSRVFGMLNDHQHVDGGLYFSGV